MAIQTKIKIEELENSFLIYDCTGGFSAANQYGYGGVNPRMDKVTESYIEIEGPGSKIPYPIKIDTSAYLPNREGTPIEVFPSQIEQIGEMLESGKYKFKYTIIIDGQEKVCYNVSVFTKSVVCCVDSHSDCLDKNAYKDVKQQKVIELNNLLQGIDYLIENGNFDKADETISYVKSQCKCQDC